MGGLLREGERVKFAFIAAEKATWPVAWMCRKLGVSRSGFYAFQSGQESGRAAEDRRLAVLVSVAHETGRRKYGSPRIHRELREEHGVRVGRNRVIRLMRAQGIQGVSRSRRRVKTTDSRHNYPVAPNVLMRDFNAAAPNERWAGDITYLRTKDGWIYLAVILDLFSRYVVGWALSKNIDRHVVLKALHVANHQRRPQLGLVHHSDQGSQYASDDYQTALVAEGFVCSMSRRGDCYDNAVVESFFGTLKAELGDAFESLEAADLALFDYIEIFYNRARRHSSLGYLSPAKYESAFHAATTA
jgi:transposase InsO family protein